LTLLRVKKRRENEKNENIIYEGKTVKECEQKFKEAALRYKKGILKE